MHKLYGLNTNKLKISKFNPNVLYYSSACTTPREKLTSIFKKTALEVGVVRKMK